MSTAIDIRRNQGFDDESRKVIRDIYAKGANDSEFIALMAIAEARGLDPRMGHCHFVKRWDSKENREVWSVQVSIDGLRTIAERTGDYDGQDEPEWTESNANVVSCRVRVYRKGVSRPFVAVAFFGEYVQKTRDGKPTKFWRDMPHVMIAKCAEALALRKAFPADSAGLYTPEEMAQAENERPLTQPARIEVVQPPIAALPVPNETVTDLLNRADTAADVAALKTVAREAGKLLTQGTDEYKVFQARYHARMRELEGPKPPRGGKPAPEAPANTDATGEVITGEHEDAAQAWSEASWRAHVDAKSNRYEVANSFARHEQELASVPSADEIAIERLIALGLDEAHAVEAIAAACDRRAKKAAA